MTWIIFFKDLFSRPRPKPMIGWNLKSNKTSSSLSTTTTTIYKLQIVLEEDKKEKRSLLSSIGWLIVTTTTIVVWEITLEVTCNMHRSGPNLFIKQEQHVVCLRPHWLNRNLFFFFNCLIQVSPTKMLVNARGPVVHLKWLVRMCHTHNQNVAKGS